MKFQPWLKKKVSSKIIGETKNFILNGRHPKVGALDGHSMRMASFYVPHSVEKGELSITEFSGNERWYPSKY